MPDFVGLATASGGFAVGTVLAGIRACAIANGDAASTIVSLQHFVPAAMFIGFASVFAAISFAIARSLGEFRTGGGAVQEAAGGAVETLKMAPTAKAFIGLMAMSMMAILAAVVAHIIIGAQISSGDAAAPADSEEWAIGLEGARRFGTALYLFAISLGLGTIIHVLRFQAIRIRDLATGCIADHQNEKLSGGRQLGDPLRAAGRRPLPPSLAA